MKSKLPYWNYSISFWTLDIFLTRHSEHWTFSWHPTFIWVPFNPLQSSKVETNMSQTTTEIYVSTAAATVEVILQHLKQPTAKLPQWAQCPEQESDWFYTTTQNHWPHLHPPHPHPETRPPEQKHNLLLFCRFQESIWLNLAPWSVSEITRKRYWRKNLQYY